MAQAALPDVPKRIAVDSVTHTAFITGSTGTVTVIDGASGAVRVVLPVGAGADAITVDPSTHTVFVALSPPDAASTVVRIDGLSDTVVSSTALPVRVTGALVGAAGSVLYLGTATLDAEPKYEVVSIDSASSAPLASLEVPFGAFDFAVDDHYLWTLAAGQEGPWWAALDSDDLGILASADAAELAGLSSVAIDPGGRGAYFFFGLCAGHQPAEPAVAGRSADDRMADRLLVRRADERRFLDAGLLVGHGTESWFGTATYRRACVWATTSLTAESRAYQQKQAPTNSP